MHVYKILERWTTKLGQNIAYEGSSERYTSANFDIIIQMWFNEYVNFTYPYYSHGTTGHYTQVLKVPTWFFVLYNFFVFRLFGQTLSM